MTFLKKNFLQWVYPAIQCYFYWYTDDEGGLVVPQPFQCFTGYNPSDIERSTELRA